LSDCLTATEKLRCLERELRYRAKVYPRLVAAQKMSQETMDKEIAVMTAIRDDYAELSKSERLL
jgi:hypothetical protein